MQPSPIHPVLPGDIEARSFAIITEEMGQTNFSPLELPVVKRAIHTSAYFDYAQNLRFTPGAVEQGLAAIRAGAVILTDTQMGRSGVNKQVLERFGGRAECYMADPDVAEAARAGGTTRAVASMDKAARTLTDAPLIVAVGNAPTALIRLSEQMEQDVHFRPALIVGVPVGFVNVVESKELIWHTCTKLGVPCIAAMGRKGGSNVAAAICNALLYLASGRTPMPKAKETP